MQTGKRYEGKTKDGSKIAYTVKEHLTTAHFAGTDSDDGVEDADHKPSRKIEVGVSGKGSFVTREVTYGPEKVVVLGHHASKEALIASLDPADSLTEELTNDLNGVEAPSEFVEV